MRRLLLLSSQPSQPCSVSLTDHPNPLSFPLGDCQSLSYSADPICDTRPGLLAALFPSGGFPPGCLAQEGLIKTSRLVDKAAMSQRTIHF